MEYASPSSGILLAVGVAALLAFVTSISRSSSSLVGKLPGPPASSWVYGNILQLVFPSVYGEFEYGWQNKYGTVYRIKGMFGENNNVLYGQEDRLMVSDPVAVQHILKNRSFIRAPTQLQTGKLIFGERSVYCAEGEDHRRLRAALSPGFSPAVVRDFLPIFSDAAQRVLRSDLMGSSLLLLDLGPWINVCNMLDHATLDVISEAALGLPINTVADPQHPLAKSHLNVLPSPRSEFILPEARRLSTAPNKILFADVLLPYIPSFILRSAVHLPDRYIACAERLSLIDDKTEEQRMGSPQGSDVLIKGLLGQRKEKLTGSELAEQIRIILLGGQDTRADALAWCLHELARDQDYQNKLRAEIELHRSASSGGRMDYDSMPLLNAFLKETLRVYPAAAYLERVAGEDLVIPLASEIVTTSGDRISHLPVKKGQFIAVAIASYQREEALWGSDANDFKPSRWLEGDPFKGKSIGPLTFSGGHRVCAGWRFAVLEMQVILAELVLNFSFGSSKDDPVRPLYAGILLPITNEGVKGLPLLIERVAH
ncbi:cytochrome P450 [Mycena polygramma]|nr:cytochrome P450 [Mycena polygramma]